MHPHPNSDGHEREKERSFHQRKKRKERNKMTGVTFAKRRDIFRWTVRNVKISLKNEVNLIYVFVLKPILLMYPLKLGGLTLELLFMFVTLCRDCL